MKVFLQGKSCGFHASLSPRRSRFGLLGDALKVAYGNNASFVEYQMMLWMALPSWFRKLSFISFKRGLEWTR